MHCQRWMTLLLLLGCSGASNPDHNHCYDVYRHGCRTSVGSSATEYRSVKSHRSCAADNVSDDVKFTVLLAENGSSLAGIVESNITLPDADCNYDIALLVNTSITDKDDCDKNVFHESNSYENEVHSIDRTICVLSSWSQSSELDCQNDTWSMWYEHVFTGCYALRFTVDGYKYSVRGNTFIVTDYRRTEVAEPKFTCHYEDSHDTDLSTELVRFMLRISIFAGTAGMRLTLVPMSRSPDEAKENACTPYTENPLHTWEIITGDMDSSWKNCSQFGNDKNAKHMDCNFLIRLPRNAGHCIRINMLDSRCHRQTIWNPPPYSPSDKLLPCVWLQSCTRIMKNTSAYEYNVGIRDYERINSNVIILLPIIVTVTVIAIAIIVTTLYLCRSRWRRAGRRVYVTANSKDSKIARYQVDVDSVETTDDETVRGSRNGDENDAIILLYARGSTAFMSLMTDFREILKIHCGCQVRDWYAAREWDVVATIGPAAWVDDLLRQNCRALWIDTPRVRSLLDVRKRQNPSNDEPKRVWERRSRDDEVVSDFRDLALPSVIDLAKKDVSNLARQYSRHYIVRLEGFDSVSRGSKDPFEELSPHTRYLIPYHLTELCSHISSWRTNLDTQRLKTEEVQLRERLARINDK